jgi:hypothetical protein
MDVFISYSSKDQAWVRGELLQRIEQAGVKAFIDFRDFTPSAPSIKEMARGVEECPKTLVVLTPDYIASEWCDLELVMGQALLGRIACFRSPVGYETLKALAEGEKEAHTKARRHEDTKEESRTKYLHLCVLVPSCETLMRTSATWSRGGCCTTTRGSAGSTCTPSSAATPTTGWPRPTAPPPSSRSLRHTSPKREPLSRPRTRLGSCARSVRTDQVAATSGLPQSGTGSRLPGLR